MPLLILSYDPNLKLERLHEPFCRSGLAATLANSNGAHNLTMPRSGIRMNATLHGAPFPATFNVFIKQPDGDWQVIASTTAPLGTQTFFLPETSLGTQAYVRAVDPAGKVCPANSGTLAAP